MDTTKPLWDLHQLEGNVEHDLFQSVIVEFTDISGIKCQYYIREERYNQSGSQDFLTIGNRAKNKGYFYGEDPATRYLPYKETRLIYEPTEESTITTGFGINSEEAISWASTPKWTFTRDVSAGYHPKPGDVVVTTWNNRAYEIADVHEEEKIFQLKKMVWGFVLRPYRFSDESDSAREIFRGTRLPTPDSKVNDRKSTLTEPLSAFGDNEEIDDESDDIFDYGGDYDSNVYGY